MSHSGGATLEPMLSVAQDYLPHTTNESTTRGYIALLENEPIGFIQSYVVMGSADRWWEQETDPGAFRN